MVDLSAYGDDLSDLWSDERCVWRIDYEAGGWGSPKVTPWVVVLEWTQEYGNPHQAEWASFTWLFYGDTIEESLAAAVEWCRDLLPWAPCGECDGKGSWNGTLCADCQGSGLANPQPIDGETSPQK